MMNDDVNDLFDYFVLIEIVQMIYLNFHLIEYYHQEKNLLTLNFFLKQLFVVVDIDESAVVGELNKIFLFIYFY
jgi:hypothetical protein